MIVHKDIAEEVAVKITEQFASKIVGNALDEKTNIGPLVSQKQLELLDAQVQDALSKGAIALTGGKKVHEGQGAYYAPTVLKNVTMAMRVMNEEVFGPVLPIITFSTDEEAIELANKTLYGL